MSRNLCGIALNVKALELRKVGTSSSAFFALTIHLLQHPDPNLRQFSFCERD